MPQQFSYSAEIVIPQSLKLDATVSFSAATLKRDLLEEIINALKDGHELPESRENYLNLVEAAITINGTGHMVLARQQFEPDYESVIGGHERVLQLLHDLWQRFFPDNPADISVSVSLNLTLEGITRALCRAHCDGCMDDDISNLTVDDTLFYVLERYIEIGESDVEMIDDVPDEIYEAAGRTAQNHFGFLGSRHSCGLG